MKRYICKDCGVKQKVKEELVKVSFKRNTPVFWAKCAACKKTVEMECGSKDA